MPSINEIDLNAMVQHIVAAVQPEQIILFGSLARDEASDESDIDLLIVQQKGFTERSRWREMQVIRQAISHFPIAKDILLYSQDEVAHWRHSLNHVVGHALREGRSLYERS
ncbi:nucleotidyltransferase domain-containing protein [Candidatus Magnetaquicoccus inordinatus]|uniref:nucleotidyltransferase domain-containing protein n=1 Tax=Candidatus Magnetaquicoccus inordinatus TaxID=2496818 RepID=UPI00102B50FE|nr:nucleotidyltransferase domain-containing protein [Candidatus Magnetaquicoccus inordinatus]